jgi:hypothetical protein
MRKRIHCQVIIWLITSGGAAYPFVPPVLPHACIRPLAVMARFARCFRLNRQFPPYDMRNKYFIKDYIFVSTSPNYDIFVGCFSVLKGEAFIKSTHIGILFESNASGTCFAYFSYNSR